MQSEDDAGDDEASESSDALLREAARVDESSSEAAPVHRPPGSRIGRFVVRGELGRGGMGVVYRAFDDTLNRSVALKVLPVLGGAKADEAKTRLLREARAAASLEHPHVVAIYEVGEHEGAPFIAMELVVGQSLRERMRDSSTLEEKIGWLSEIAEALGAAHDKGIVHRDVKPENVMIKRDGHVKVLDFGIARQSALPVDPSAPTEASGERLGTLTAEGVLVGTPRYMAPEQLHGDKLDGRCDQFAWGVVAYELFAGKPPWSGPDAVALIANILDKPAPELSGSDAPHAVVAAVARALSKQPSDRFASMSEAVDAIHAFRGEAAVVSREALAVRAPRRRRLAWLAASAVVLVAGAAVAWLAFRGVSAPRAAVDAATAAARAPAAPRVVVMTELALPQSAAPKALSEYRAGLQAFRDGNVVAARDHFRSAHDLDPGMGAAWFRDWYATGPTPAEHAATFHKALDLRAGMPEHEAELFDALTPCGLGRGHAVGWCVEAVRAFAERHPTDAEAQLWLCVQENLAGHMAASKAAAQQAVDLDPKFGMAWSSLLGASRYIGDDAAILRESQACAAAIGSAACSEARASMAVDTGDAALLESVAREWLRMDPKSYGGFTYLAQAEACAGASTATQRHVVDQMVITQDEELRDAERRRDVGWFAWMRGDFDAVLDYHAGQDAFLAQATDMNRIAFATSFHMQALIEIGRRADALVVGRRFLERRPTLTLNGSFADTDGTLQEEGFGMILRELREAGMDRDEARRMRDAYVAEWKPKLGPDYLPFLWMAGYAEPAVDESDAREALEQLPKFGGTPNIWENLPGNGGGQGLVGRVYQLAGRVDEAIPWLERGQRACVEPFTPLPTMSSFWLGQAREKKGDKAKACEAYAFVLKRWGNAKPKSVTADEAKKRRQALGCER